MARTESKAIMGYLPIEERHYPALLSLVAPATPSHRLLDPFANALALGWFNPPHPHAGAVRWRIATTRYTSLPVPARCR
ncbi:MAG: hypothetical protein H6671_04220 [Anaerolineaceae bacterium]|nr:hypothetical protein [Anaerolineaceae bacterium]